MTRLAHTAAARIAMLSALAAAPGAAADVPAPLIARARAALGADWTRTHGALRLRGDAAFLRRDAAIEIVLAADGRYLRQLEGPVGVATGFDGERSWAADWTGMPREVVFAERDWQDAPAIIASGAWLRDGSPFEIAAAPTEAAVTLRRPGSPVSMRLELDPATHLPARLVRGGVLGEQRIEFSRFREIAGARVPTRIVESSSADTTVYDLGRIEALERAPDHAFSAPVAPADARFAPGLAPEIDVRRARTGHLLVHPRVDGRDLGWFLFDSGAGHSTLAPAAAESLGLPVLALSASMSIRGLQPAPVRRADSLRLGPLTIERPVFADFDLTPFATGFGESLAGIIGFDVMRRAVVELEIATNRLVLHDPAGFDGRDLPWQTLHLVDRHPVIEATFEGHTGWFKLDVGASGGPFGNVTLHAPAVERLGLLEGREVEKEEGHMGAVAVGRARSVELGGRRFENELVVFSTAETEGPFRDAQTLGNIGLQLMAPFRIVFDYARGRIAFVERAGS